MFGKKIIENPLRRGINILLQNRSLVIRFWTLPFILFVGFAIMEIGKDLLFPGISKSASLIITIVFTIILGSAATYLFYVNIFKLDLKLKEKYRDSKKLENALMDAEERYHAIFKQLSDAVFLIDVNDGAIVDFNSNVFLRLDYKPEDFEGFSLSNFDRIGSQEAFRKHLEKVFKSGSDVFETKLKNRRGEGIDFLIKTNLISIKDKKYFLSVWKDIAETRKMRKDINEREKFLNMLIETIPLPVFYKNKQGRYTGCNIAFEDFFGVSKEEILGKTVHDLNAAKELADEYYKKDTELFKNGGKQVYESKLKTRKSGIRDVVLHKSAFRDSEGNVSGLLGLILDITEQKKSKEYSEKTRISLLSQNKALVKWTSPETLYNENIGATLRDIIETMAKIIDVERVGIWIYNDDFTKIYCIDLFIQSTKEHSRGLELSVANYPTYFKAIKTQRVIAADDARTDVRTKEFLESYLIPTGITSMMDVPINVGAKCIGIICSEHVGTLRQWSLEEQNFAISVANLISFMMEISKRRQTEHELVLSRDIFNSIVEKCATGIIITDIKGKILFVNPAAESFFCSKTGSLPGELFTYPLHPGKVSEIDIVSNNKAGKGRMSVVETKWKGNSAYLISVNDVTEYKNS